MQLLRQKIGRVDDKHAAAVHAEAVGARALHMQLGLQVIIGCNLLQLRGSLRLSSRLRQGYHTK